jgi:hypothetical protein
MPTIRAVVLSVALTVVAGHTAAALVRLYLIAAKP